MCAGLVYASTKADSWALSALATFSTAALMCYTMVFFNRHEVHFKAPGVSQRVSNVAGSVMTLGATALLFTWLMRAFIALVELIPSIKGAIS